MFLFTYLLSCRPDKEKNDITKLRANPLVPKGTKASSNNSNASEGKKGTSGKSGANPLAPKGKKASSNNSNTSEGTEGLSEKSESSVTKIEIERKKDELIKIDESERAISLSAIFKEIDNLEDLTVFIDKDNKIAGLSIDQIVAQLEKASEGEVFSLFSRISELETKGYISFGDNNYRKKFLDIIFSKIKFFHGINKTQIPGLAKEAANIFGHINEVQRSQFESIKSIYMKYVIKEIDNKKALLNALIATSNLVNKDSIRSIIPENMSQYLEEVFQEFNEQKLIFLKEEVQIESEQLEKKVSEKLKIAKELFDKKDMDNYNLALRDIDYLKSGYLSYILSKEGFITVEELQEAEEYYSTLLQEAIDNYFTISEEDSKLALLERIEHLIQKRNPQLRKAIEEQIKNKLSSYIYELFSDNSMLSQHFERFVTIISSLLNKNLSTEELNIITELFGKIYSQYEDKNINVISTILKDDKFAELFKTESDKLAEIIREDESVVDEQITEIIYHVKDEAVSKRLMNEYLSSDRDYSKLRTSPFRFKNYLDNKPIIDYYLSTNYRNFSLEIPENQRVDFLRSLFSIEGVADPYRVTETSVQIDLEGVDISYKEDRDLYLSIARAITPNNKELIRLIERYLLKLKDENKELLIKLLENIDVDKLEPIISEDIIKRGNFDIFKSSYEDYLKDKRDFIASLFEEITPKRDFVIEYFDKLIDEEMNRPDNVILKHNKALEQAMNKPIKHIPKEEAFSFRESTLKSFLENEKLYSHEKIEQIIADYFKLYEEERYSLILLDKILSWRRDHLLGLHPTMKLKQKTISFFKNKIEEQISDRLYIELKSDLDRASDEEKSKIVDIIISKMISLFHMNLARKKVIEIFESLYKEYYNDYSNMDRLHDILNEMGEHLSENIQKMVKQQKLSVIEDRDISDEQVIEFMRKYTDNPIKNRPMKEATSSLTKKYLLSDRDNSKLKPLTRDRSVYLAIAESITADSKELIELIRDDFFEIQDKDLVAKVIDAIDIETTLGIIKSNIREFDQSSSMAIKLKAAEETNKIRLFLEEALSKIDEDKAKNIKELIQGYFLLAN